MAYEFFWKQIVAFSEVDAAGMVHFSQYFRYMENAEHAFFRSLGLSIHDPKLPWRWPRAATKCDYQGPLRFEDEVVVHLMVERVGRTSLTYCCRIYNSQTPSRVAAMGSLTAVCCVVGEDDGRLVATPIGDLFLTKIQQAPAERLTASPR